jgi:DNA-directed RNA polymerase subunit RPC12/RpoP
MTNSVATEVLKCKRCGEEFVPPFATAILCAQCRRHVVKKERSAARREGRREITAAQVELTWDQSRRAEWDIMVTDEIGRPVWARDLAKRYRNELDARQRRNWKHAKDHH